MKAERSFFTEVSVKLRDGDRRPRLAVTLGDPAGIGPEVILKALADPDVIQDCDITVVGSRSLLAKIYADLSDSVQFLADPAQLSILDVELDGDLNQIIAGTGNAASGAASFAYMERAIRCALAGEFQAIVTGPIAKSAWKAAGYNYPGQTELLAERSGVERFGMLFVARSPHTGWILRTLLATTHIPLRQVADALTPQLMSAKLDLLIECLREDFGIDKPRIAVAGLNPHSGEQGQLGREELDWLIPWLEEERNARPYAILDGLVPPDTMWVKPGQAWYGNSKTAVADGYLALYHDQGLIPVKLMAFDRAVNTTIGLPFIRTSPDHGTAFDIAGKGIADATSMKAALQLAVELANQKVNEKL
ncbi:4-hydroxythreonine-4-phosphate dehydrogenase PdxA [Argonema galeatum]|uniref:4-hydroxythreonine-4-phosphate dehydrogenase PdxA n=1 Tax=Argonema galeatum TaxID=2942762 RepID=UPI002012E45C|nr:4-hydroxythreonine-4-phosphate dehydrogenase PdxA [Argonema galeatum]MCL1468273.1 4-hydroxythreonine-4-phosphate dehydrogenase PdxA [Argonema galeatum A003/A1]